MRPYDSQVARSWDTLVGHSCGPATLSGTLLWYTLSGLLYETLVRTRSRVQLLWGSLAVKCPERLFRARFPPKPTGQVSKTSVAYKTSSQTQLSSLQNERFVRESFLKNSFFKSAKRATSSKTHASSLRDERFVRGFLQKSRVKFSKASVSYEASFNSEAGSLNRDNSLAKQFRNSSPSRPQPQTHQSQCHIDLHQTSQPHDSCACHENLTSTPPTRAKYCAGHDDVFMSSAKFAPRHMIAIMVSTRAKLDTPIHQNRNFS